MTQNVNESNGVNQAGNSIHSTTVEARRSGDLTCSGYHQLVIQKLRQINRQHIGVFAMAIAIIISQAVSILITIQLFTTAETTGNSSVDHVNAYTKEVIDNRISDSEKNINGMILSGFDKMKLFETEHRDKVQGELEFTFRDAFRDYEDRIKNAVDARIARLMLEAKKDRDTELAQLKKELTERIKEECNKKLEGK